MNLLGTHWPAGFTSQTTTVPVSPHRRTQQYGMQQQRTKERGNEHREEDTLMTKQGREKWSRSKM